MCSVFERVDGYLRTGSRRCPGTRPDRRYIGRREGAGRNGDFDLTLDYRAHFHVKIEIFSPPAGTWVYLSVRIFLRILSLYALCIVTVLGASPSTPGANLKILELQ